ncbi:hypothetical protein [Burkholderia ubonensis]|uniref:hypothetical protein n=1 Tax=Burkholderia ubonensis TaxID=101571 RepID=UPI000ACEDDDE|nr:hypothetical protein [Burkholderia ubonensis]
MEFLFFPLFILVGLIVLISPWVAVAGTLIWLSCFVFNVSTPQNRKRLRLKRKRWWWLTACILLIFDAALVPKIRESHERQMNDYRMKISYTGNDSVLTKTDIEYHGLLIPAGSIVECLGYDYGTFDRLTALNPADALCAARFSRPVTAQGIEFTALVPDGYNGTNLHNYGYVELSKDQEINGQSCKKGDMAHYTTPGVSFREPLAPEKWKFEGCGNDEKPIRLTAVPPPPKPGFWDAFFDALLPHPGGFYCC